MRTIATDTTGFPEYHKIETLFERDERFVVNPDKLKSPVLATISKWDVTEKIDGTHIRVMVSETGELTLGGRTDKAMIPGDFYSYLQKTFTADHLKSVLWIEGATKVTLYGEGYGPGIQKGGGLYRADKSFILFDVLVGDQWWLGRQAVEQIAKDLEIDSVPFLGEMTLDEIIQFVRQPFASKIGTATAEGIVARPLETLYDKHGKRLIIKLKTKDFVPGKR